LGTTGEKVAAAVQTARMAAGDVDPARAVLISGKELRMWAMSS
jgi:hypothetical protein